MPISELSPIRKRWTRGLLGAGVDAHVRADQRVCDADRDVARSREPSSTIEFSISQRSIDAVGADRACTGRRSASRISAPGADDRRGRARSSRRPSRPARPRPCPRRGCLRRRSRVARASNVSSTMRLASSMSSILPVSFHQPVTRCGCTVLPWSISHWIASVISSSPRALRLDRLDRLADRCRRTCRRRRARGPTSAASASPSAGRRGRPRAPRRRTARGFGTFASRICAVAVEPAELVDERGDAVGDDVVAQVHDERLVARNGSDDQRPRAPGRAARPAGCR